MAEIQHDPGQREAARLQLLEANIRALGDVPALPTINAWQRVHLEPSGELLAPLSLGEEGSPLMSSSMLQCAAVRQVVDLRARVEAGEGGAVLEAVALCLAHGLVAPGWLAASFVLRVDRVHSGAANDWGDVEVFGRAVPKGMNRAGVEAMKQVGPEAYRAALDLLASDPARPIDKGFFEAVGERVGRGATAAEVLVRKHVESRDGAFPSPAALKPFLAQHDGDLEKALSAWSYADSLQTWTQAGGLPAEFEAIFDAAGDVPKNSGELSGLQA